MWAVTGSARDLCICDEVAFNKGRSPLEVSACLVHAFNFHVLREQHGLVGGAGSIIDVAEKHNFALKIDQDPVAVLVWLRTQDKYVSWWSAEVWLVCKRHIHSGCCLVCDILTDFASCDH